MEKVNVESDNSTTKLFKLSCIVTQSKYLVLRENFPLIKTELPIETNIFISIPSIFNTWSQMINSYNGIPSHFNKEFIVSSMLNIAAHYKGFFRNSKIYFYLGKEEIKYPDEYTDEVHKALNLWMKTTCRYIPNVYYIKARDVPGCAIIGNILQSFVESNPDKYLQTVFITTNPGDYAASAIRNGEFIKHSFLRGFGSNKRFVIGDSIVYDWLIRNNGSHLKEIPYSTLMLYGLLSQPKKSKIYSDADISRDAKELLKALIYENTEEIQTAEKEFRLTIGDVRDFVDIWYSLSKYNDRLALAKIDWLVDYVDYSIETLNDTVFRGIPVNLHELYSN